MTWLLSEAIALKKKLSTVSISDATSDRREVPVHFLGPDFNLVDAVYPGIYVEYAGMTRAFDREHRGRILVPYAPEGMAGNVTVPTDVDDKESLLTETWILDSASDPDPRASPYLVQDSPVPWNLDFQVSVRTRNYQQAFQIIERLAELPYLPTRYGCLEVPEDGTLRTLDLLGGPEVTLDTDQDGKRIVLTLYSVRVVSEKSLFEIKQIQRVATIVNNVAYDHDLAEGD